MTQHNYQQGDLIIYRQRKYSTHPGPRAIHVDPAARGEEYSYEVDKFWIVTGFARDGLGIIARTRTGKTHILDPNSPRLRKANWLERVRWRHKFPTLAQAAARR